MRCLDIRLFHTPGRYCCCVIAPELRCTTDGCHLDTSACCLSAKVCPIRYASSFHMFKHQHLPAILNCSELMPTSFLVADSIKTLDMSLPTYNDISNAKASVTTVKGLAVTPTSQNARTSSGSSGGQQATKKPASSTKTSGSPGKYNF